MRRTGQIMVVAALAVLGLGLGVPGGAPASGAIVRHGPSADAGDGAVLGAESAVTSDDPQGDAP